MKKTALLNQPLSCVIAGLGHMDRLVIADAGLPIPEARQRIDLAVKPGMPPLIDVLRTVLDEMQVESAILAYEMAVQSPPMHTKIQTLLADIPVEMVSHEQFKMETATARAIVRTGEFTPYANVILVAGVVF